MVVIDTTAEKSFIDLHGNLKKKGFQDSIIHIYRNYNDKTEYLPAINFGLVMYRNHLIHATIGFELKLTNELNHPKMQLYAM